MSASAEHPPEALHVNLAPVPLQDLVNELSHREGVALYDVSDEEHYAITKGGPLFHKKTLESYDGPVQILTVVTP